MSEINCKVVLLGSAYAGKTCLLERFIHERFNDKTETTIAGSFASKVVKIDTVSVTLGCWDTAGCERYATLSRMYYRNARAAIVCFDLTNRHSYEMARNWISELFAQEENCKIYICGNKKDLVDNNACGQRCIQKEDARVLANDLQADYFETSSKTGENIDAVFKKIAKDFATAESEMCTNGLRTNDSIKISSWRKDPRVRQSEEQDCCHRSK